MRLAIVSDIHGNLAALEAVIAALERERPELVVQGGDLALGGAHPAEVVDRVRELDWPGVVGNTDELLWRPDQLALQEARAPKLCDLLRVLFESQAPATRELLGPERLAWLRALPAERLVEGVLLLHASPGDLWWAPSPDAEDEALLATYGGLGAGTVVYGHIHRPYVRALAGLTVANSGSVGMPFDRDPRASYLLVEDGQPSVRRVEYDVEREADALVRRRYPQAEWLAERLRRGSFIPIPSLASRELLLRRMYAAFNARDIEAVLAATHPEVDWPDALEGGRLRGHAAVRDYWRRQFRLIDPRVEPERITAAPDGRIVVDVHQVVHDPEGGLLADRRVQHVFSIRDGLIESMHVREC
jgi:predicted phosphodiesterase/ketosteroid isomerase-like protein